MSVEWYVELGPKMRLTVNAETATGVMVAARLEANPLHRDQTLRATLLAAVSKINPPAAATTKISPPATSKISPPRTRKINLPATRKTSPPSTKKINLPRTKKVHLPATRKINPPATRHAVFQRTINAEAGTFRVVLLAPTACSVPWSTNVSLSTFLLPPKAHKTHKR